MQRGWRGAALALAAGVVMAGGALAQGFGAFGGGAMMLHAPEVQTEIKLTDEQKTKLGDLLQKIRDQRQGAFQELQSLSPEERQKRFMEWQASDTKSINGMLNADQQKRFRQLQLQQQGLSAVAVKQVADELKLTDDQRAKVQAAVEEQGKSIRALFEGAGGQGGFDPQAMRPKFEAIRKQTEAKISAALTDDQKKQWKEMQGAPFTFPAFRPGA